MFDIVGVALLVILIVLFGALALRAWKGKSRWLKWIGTILSGLLTTILAALLALALIGFYKLNKRYDNTLAELRVAGTPDQVARGEKLANICVSCHSQSNQLPLAGSNFAEKFEFPPLGTL